MLEIRNLTKIYDDGTVALKDVSFRVPDGEFLVVIGLSGSGKSTLLRCINRLIDPTEGEIIWNGVKITELQGGELRKTRRQHLCNRRTDRSLSARLHRTNSTYPCNKLPAQ